MRIQKRDRKTLELDRKDKMNKLAERSPTGRAARQMIHKAYQGYSTVESEQTKAGAAR